MLEKWHARSIVPTNYAAVSRVQDHVLSRLDNETRDCPRDPLPRPFRFRHETWLHTSPCSMARFGRTDPRGFRSYSLRTRDHLSINRLRSGSTILELLSATLENTELWRTILAYLAMGTGLGVAAKTWAAAAKTLAEATNEWLDVVDRLATSRARALRRRQRSAIRSLIQANPLFEGLSRPDVDVLVQLVEDVLVAERSHLPAAVRF